MKLDSFSLSLAFFATLTTIYILPKASSHSIISLAQSPGSCYVHITGPHMDENPRIQFLSRWKPIMKKISYLFPQTPDIWARDRKSVTELPIKREGGVEAYNNHWPIAIKLRSKTVDCLCHVPKRHCHYMCYILFINQDRHLKTIFLKSTVSTTPSTF